MGDSLRLQKFLAQAGIASRREAERMIVAGRVMLNGKTVTELGTCVESDDTVSVDGHVIGEKPALTYLMLNKPEGFLVTRTDTHGRKTVYDLLSENYHHLHPVGRLDGNSCGLLLLTNDGELTARLLHPRYHVEKRYQVEVSGRIQSDQIEALCQGITLDDGPTQPADIRLLKSTRSGAVLEFRLREGKKRQIRRMCEAMQWRVRKLQRLAMGGLTLGPLPESKARELTAAETKSLRRAAGLS